MHSLNLTIFLNIVEITDLYRLREQVFFFTLYQHPAELISLYSNMFC